MTLETLPVDLELPVLQTRIVRKPHGFTSENQPFGRRGRKKGSISKITSDIKQGVLRGAANCGYDGQGLGGVDGFLLACAQRYPKHYLALLGRMLPMTMTPEATSPTITSVNILAVPAGTHLTVKQMEALEQGEPLTLDHEQTIEEPVAAEEPIEVQSSAEEERVIADLKAEIRELSQKMGVPCVV